MDLIDLPLYNAVIKYADTVPEDDFYSLYPLFLINDYEIIVVRECSWSLFIYSKKSKSKVVKWHKYLFNDIADYKHIQFDSVISENLKPSRQHCFALNSTVVAGGQDQGKS
jgi:hypothetical protein